MKCRVCIPAVLLTWMLLATVQRCQGQQAYFIDGYHGGVYGHYPAWYTAFINEQLRKHPSWKINLEIEPETWDSVLLREPAALLELQQFIKNPESGKRVEFVNPAYGQPYFFAVSGESMIRQFAYGIQKLKTYFPSASINTYSSEEPCFTSSLPQVLRSFGFSYASLKNPNTCWGGYVRAHGGELLNWVGPDGSKILTVPRYSSEGFEPRSTWQTTGWTNSPRYINEALRSGIKNPVGMCLQDAGWRNGPWMGDPPRGPFANTYTTWSEYFSNYSSGRAEEDWRLSQEDIQVSLVWGAQVLQRIAQQVRTTENKLLQAEKLAALSRVYLGNKSGPAPMDEAWRTLMLAQHHDCWIVPYNGSRGNRWIEKVVRWTGSSNHIADSVAAASMRLFSTVENKNTVRVFNTSLHTRDGWITIPVPDGYAVKNPVTGKFPEQTVQAGKDSSRISFKVTVPSLGYTSFILVKEKPPVAYQGASIYKQDSQVILETNLYRLVIDPAQGGRISSLVAKKMGNRELVDTALAADFNGLRGFFYKEGGLRMSDESQAAVTVKQNDGAILCAEISGSICGQPFIQTITLKQDDPLIDMNLQVNWNRNAETGDTTRKAPELTWKRFYDDRNKLLLVFPLRLQQPQLYKNAPFDVTESKLENTFFNHWDSIKNNIILNWVDVYDKAADCGMALFTDHTSTYTFGPDFPLGLTVQYNGAGLWGRNYTVEGPTSIHYALLPHKGKWDESGVEQLSVNWNEPLLVDHNASAARKPAASLLQTTANGWQLLTVLQDKEDLLIRLYNASGDSAMHTVTADLSADKVSSESLNGTLLNELQVKKTANGKISFKLAIPRFGFRTIRLHQLAKSK